MLIMKRLAASFCAVTSFLGPSHAATLITDAVKGRLLGANQVDVNGALFDVRFVQGTCAELFDGCNEQSDLSFDNPSDAIDASQALLDQVIINAPGLGNFDTQANLVQGCDIHTRSLGNCSVLVLYELRGSTVSFASAVNINRATRDVVGVGSIGVNQELIEEEGRSFAVFAQSGAGPSETVPIPAGFFLILPALALLRMDRKQPLRFRPT